MIYLNNREKSVESEKNSRKYAKKSESDPFCPPDPLCPPPPYTKDSNSVLQEITY